MKLKHIIRQLQQIEAQHGDLDSEFVTHFYKNDPRGYPVDVMVKTWM